MKLKEKEQAIALRKRGYSLKEISERLGVAKSTASLWLRDVSLSRSAQNILRSKYTKGQLASQEARRRMTQEKMDEARKRAKGVVRRANMSADSKRILCAVLYWCEGSKAERDKDFTFTNSDPYLVQVFLGLFRENFRIDETKFRVCVHLHEYHDKQKQLQFWSKVTNIPICNFIKPYMKSHTGKRIRKGYQGCIAIRYSDVVISREVQAIAREYLHNHEGPIG